MKRWILAGTVLFLASGCPGFGDKTLAEIEGIGDELVTYHADIKPILDQRCVTCHRDPPIAGAPNALVTYEQALTFAQRIEVRTVQEGTMPPGGGVPDSEKALISAWVAAGAPEGDPAAAEDMGVDPDPDMGPEPDMGPAPDMGDDPGPDMGMEEPPTWVTDVEPVMAANCAFPGCHGGDNPSSQLDLTTFDGFIAGGFGGDLTGGGDPEVSGLIDRLYPRAGLPLMPQGGPRLDDDTIAMMEAWIAAGSPEE